MRTAGLTGYERKGASPDSVEGRKAAEEARRQSQEFTAAQNELNRGVTTRGQDISARNAAAAREAAQKNKPMPPAEADARTKLGQVNAARDSIKKLTESSGKLSDWQTGPVAGRRAGLGGMTDAEQTFEADVAAVTAQILGATKVPGTGAQSDRDAARLDALTPQLTDDSAARHRKIKGLNDWVDEIERTNAGMVSGDAVTPQSGNLTKNSDGSFNYTPGAR